MNYEELQNVWAQKYQEVPSQLEKLKRVRSAATAFNTNVDAILKISGKTLKKLILDNHISLADLENITISGFNKPSDVILGIVKCFSRGIAEEWVTDDINVYNWMEENLGYNRLQMGGQAGIIANALALLGVKKVLAHTNSHPKLQAQQFLNLDNLLGFDDEGHLEKAVNISRETDIPLIHWIIEFDKGDVFELEDYKISCPKANRFIATYDPMNSNLVRDEHFVDYMDQAKTDVVILSGYHALTAEKNGVFLVENSLPVIKKWQQNGALLHLEIASTQDKIVRKTIVDKVATLADSIGLNERETIDVLEVIGEESLAEICESKINSRNLFEAIMKIK